MAVLPPTPSAMVSTDTTANTGCRRRRRMARRNSGMTVNTRVSADGYPPYFLSEHCRPARSEGYLACANATEQGEVHDAVTCNQMGRYDRDGAHHESNGVEPIEPGP